jgi:hypothetical protein
MRKKPTGKIKQAFIMIVPLAFPAEFTWTTRRGKLNAKVRIFSLVEEMVTKNRKTVEIEAKEYVRLLKEWSKKSK